MSHKKAHLIKTDLTNNYDTEFSALKGFEVRPQKKVVLFPDFQVNFFYHSPARIVECISQYIFLISKRKKSKRIKKTKKAKEIKEENKIFVKNLTGYDDTFCEFALCSFNSLD